MTPRLSICVLLCIAAVGVLATPPQNTNDYLWSVVFKQAYWTQPADAPADCQNVDVGSGTTTFEYTVNPDAHDIGHFILTAVSATCTDALSSLQLADGQDLLWKLDEDAQTHVKGFKYILGIPHGTPQTVSITFQGRVPSAQNSFVGYVRSGKFTHEFVGLPGPSCSYSEDEVPVSWCPSSPCVTDASKSYEKSGCQGDAPNLVAGWSPNGPKHLQGLDTTVQGKCRHDFTVVRTWSVPTQYSGYSVRCIQNVHIVDTTPPSPPSTWSNPDVFQEHIVRHCKEGVGELPLGEWTDNCPTGLDGSKIVKVEPCREDVNGTCVENKAELRTWTATDECGNSVCKTQTVSIVDNVAPTFNIPPSDPDQQCLGPIANPGEPTNKPEADSLQDNCDCPLEPVHREYLGFYPGDCANTGEYVWKFQAHDCCGNKLTKLHTRVIVDTVKPTLTPGDTLSRTAKCHEPKAPISFTSYDACSGTAVPVSNTSTWEPLPPPYFQCAQNRRRIDTYTACDNCGNNATATAYVTFTDTEAPTFTISEGANVPENGTTKYFECGSDNYGAPIIEDKCAIPNTTFTDPKVPVNAKCVNNYTQVKTWISHDDCGNYATYTYTLIATDTTPVHIDESKVPYPKNLICYGDLDAEVQRLKDALPNITAQACGNALHCNCEQSFDRTFVEKDYEGTACLGSKVVGFVFTDKCGNTDTVWRTIHVKDSDSPVAWNITQVPTLECSDAIPAHGVYFCDDCACPDPKGDGSCDVSCRIPVDSDTIEPIPGTKTCDGTLKKRQTWTGHDNCGHVQTAHRDLTFRDTTAPSLTPPGPLTVPCDKPVPEQETINGTDLCSKNVTVVKLPRTEGVHTCENGYEFFYWWQAFDDCGNPGQVVSQKVTIYDDKPPTITMPDGFQQFVNVEDCNNIPKPAKACASDNCKNVTISFNETVVDTSDKCKENKIIKVITRTWTAKDACGKTADPVVQTLYVLDKNPPVPNDYQKYYAKPCNAQFIPQKPTGVDACKYDVDVDWTPSGEPGLCKTYNRTYDITFTDKCGNTVPGQIIVHFEDSQAPQFTDVPPNPYPVLHCNDTKVPDPQVSDVCSGVVNPSSEFPKKDVITAKVGRCPNEKYMLTWKAHDNCGNPNSVSTVVEIQDTEGPKATPPPAATYTCSEPAFEYTWQPTDDCDQAPTVTRLPDEYISYRCANKYEKLRKWQITDFCNKSTDVTQYVNVTDNFRPTFNPKPNTTDYVDECSPPGPQTVCAFDNCQNVTVTTKKKNGTRTCKYRYDYTQYWIAKDNCGQQTVLKRKVTINDHTPPHFENTLGDKSYDCKLPDDFNVNDYNTFPTGTVVENCKEYDLKPFHSLSPGKCKYAFKFNVAWRATDLCFQEAWNNYTLTVNDKPFTKKKNLPDKTFNCGTTDPGNWDVITTANVEQYVNLGCTPKEDLDITSTAPVEQTDPGLCKYRSKWTKTWTIKDKCDTTLTVTQTQTGQYTPLIDGSLPADECTEKSCKNTDVPFLPPGLDNCRNAVTVTSTADDPKITDAKDAKTCRWNKDRTWTFHVNTPCGDTDTQTITYKNRDKVGPKIFTSGDITSLNNCTEPAAPTAHSEDVCDGIVVLNASPPNCGTDCNRVCTYTFTAEDECGNPAEPSPSQDVKYTYIWNQRPTLNLDGIDPAASNLPCSYVLDAKPATATDACGTPHTVFPISTNTSGRCVYDHTTNLTWVFTDKCGLAAEPETRIYDWDPPAPPTLSPIDQSEVYAQCGWEPCPPEVTASSSCPGVRIEFSQSQKCDVDCCNCTFTRTWQAIDKCGTTSVSNATQYVYIYTHTPPYLQVPSDRFIDCPAQQPNQTVLEAKPSNLDEPHYESGRPAPADGFCVLPHQALDDCRKPGDLSSPSWSFTVNSRNFEIKPFSGTGADQYFIRYATAQIGQAVLHLEIQEIGGALATGTLDIHFYNGVQGSPTGLNPGEHFNPGCVGPAGPVFTNKWFNYPTAVGTIKLSDGQTYDITQDALAATTAGRGADTWESWWGLTVRGTIALAPFTINIPLLVHKQDVACDLTTLSNHKFPELKCNPNIAVTFNQTCQPNACYADAVCLNEWCVVDKDWISDDAKVCKTTVVTKRDIDPPTVIFDPNFSHQWLQDGKPTPSIELGCKDPVPVYSAQCQDVCDGPKPVEPEGTEPPGPCPDHTWTRTWNCTDCSGNPSAVVSQTIHRKDSYAPVLSVTCPVTSKYCTAPEDPIPTASDDCAGDITNRINKHGGPHDTPATTGKICPQHKTRKWTFSVTDDCGKPDEKTCETEIYDDRGPGNVQYPLWANTQKECTFGENELNYIGENITATDDCSNATPTITRTDTPGTYFNKACNPRLRNITVDWVAKDECGNPTPASAQWTYSDTLGSHFINEPEKTKYFKCKHVPPGNLTAVDQCEGSHSVAPTEELSPNLECPHRYTATYTWRWCDCSGNPCAEFVQTQYINDDVNPEISDVSQTGGTFTCKNVPKVPKVCATDNCEGVSVSTNFEKTGRHPNYPLCDKYNLTRWFDATDACLNSNHTQYTIIVDDVTPPGSSDPTVSKRSYDCSEIPSVVAPVCDELNPDCSGCNVYGGKKHRTDGKCAGTFFINRTWAITDHCGNKEHKSITYDVTDTTGPTLSSIPPKTDIQLTYECKRSPSGHATPNPLDVSLIDDCSTPLPNFDKPDGVPTNCGWNVTWSFNGTDDCGNPAQNPFQLPFQFIDMSVPEFTKTPAADVYLNCTDALPTPQKGDPDWPICTDTCDLDVQDSVHYTDSAKIMETERPCVYRYHIIRTWHCKDCSGKETTFPQTFHFSDDIDPTFTGPAPSPPADTMCDPPPIPKVCANDNCPGLDWQYHSTDVPFGPTGCLHKYVQHRNWTVIDKCGHSKSIQQDVTINDKVGPSCTPAPPADKDCSDPAKNNPGLRPADPVCFDVCDGVINPVYKDHEDTPLSPCVLVRKFNWVATDKCGNPTYSSTTWTFTDSEGPDFDYFPPDTPIACNDVGPRQTPTGKDNCAAASDLDVVPGAEYTEPPNANVACDGHALFRPWTVYDKCGRSKSRTQKLTVIDNTPPHIDPVPDKTVTCDKPTFTFPPFKVSDDCQTNIQANVPDTDDYHRKDGKCESVYDKIYNITVQDSCGNLNWTTLTVHVTNPTNVEISGLIEKDHVERHQCKGDYRWPDVCCKHPCKGHRLTSDTVLKPGSCANRYNLTRNWTCSDRCDHIDQARMTIAVYDDTPPQFDELSIPANHTGVNQYECYPGTDAMPNGTDNCSPDTIPATMKPSPIYDRTCKFNYSFDRVYTIKDDCGQADVRVQKVDVRDTLPPSGEPILNCFKRSQDTTNNEAALTTYTFRYVTNPVLTELYTDLHDACTARENLTLTFQSCTSDQGDEYLENASADCKYNAAADTVELTNRVSNAEGAPNGRLWEIVFSLTDECGHTTYLTSTFLVTANQNTLQNRGFPWKGLNFSQCGRFPEVCLGDCQLQPVEHFCLDTGAPEATELDYTLSIKENVDGDHSRTVDGDLTIFKFTVYADCNNFPARVTIGFPVSAFQVVHYTEGAVLGSVPGQFLEGITWDNAYPLCADNEAHFFFSVLDPAHAFIPNVVGQFPWEFPARLAPFAMSTFYDTILPCYSVETTAHQLHAELFDPLKSVFSQSPASPVAVAGDVTGYVKFDKVQFSSISALPAVDLLDVPIAAAAVKLKCKTAVFGAYKEVITFTDSNGFFTFSTHAVSAQDLKSCSVYPLNTLGAISFAGEGDRGLGQFFLRFQSGVEANENLVPSVSLDTDLANPVRFSLTYIAGALPQYNQRFDTFVGNSRPLSWWKFQSDLGLTSSLTAAAKAALNCVSAFGFTSEVISPAELLKNEATAAALNHASGRGFFDPYRPVQAWLLRAAGSLFCRATAPEQPENQAFAELVHKVNIAIDAPEQYLKLAGAGADIHICNSAVCGIPKDGSTSCDIPCDP